MSRTVLVTITVESDPNNPADKICNWSFSTESSRSYEDGGTGLDLYTQSQNIIYNLDKQTIQNKFQFIDCTITPRSPNNVPTKTLSTNKTTYTISFPTRPSPRDNNGASLVFSATNGSITTSSPDPDIDDDENISVGG